MGDISKHFNKSEFTCKCGCGFVIVNEKLLAVLEAIREHFGQPVTLNCVCRCTKHNAEVGGAKKSYHLTGMAADIVVKGQTPAAVFAFISKNWPDSLGSILYKTFTHVDVRPGKYREIKSK